MTKMLHVCLLGGALALFLNISAALPVEGTWEGSSKGLKAVTLTVHETKGELQGEAVFYVLRDDGGGLYIAGEDRRPMVGPRWDGKTLRFSVGPPSFDREASGASFAMTLYGNRAELKNLIHDEVPGQPMARNN